MPRHDVQGFTMLDTQSLRIAEGLYRLCQATLRAAHATRGSLRHPEFEELRRTVLQHLMSAEGALASPDGRRVVPQRSLLLAQEFEDLETIVQLMAESDLARLDALMAESNPFRREALALFLKTQKLHPLFFRSIKEAPLSEPELEDLLAPYPELRWTLELQGLASSSTNADWQSALQRVGRRAAASVRNEVHSAARRDMFAALATLAQAASSTAEEVDSTVHDLACMGRLQRVVRRFGDTEAPSGSKGRGGPPATAEDLLAGLCVSIRKSLGELQKECQDGQVLADCARLIFLIEKGLVERAIDIVSLLKCNGHAPEHLSKDASTAKAVQRFWAEVIWADEDAWREALARRQGAVFVGETLPELPPILARTGFFKMLASRPVPRPSQCPPLPASADVSILCDALAELQPLQPVLEEVARAAALSSSTALYGKV
jgi:hypothetical protein